MTDDQINAAIAEVCGWTDIHDSGPWHNHKLWGYPPELQGQGGNAYKYMPDYCKDLNAMRQAEMVALGGSTAWLEFAVNLMRVLEAEQMSELDGMTRILQATARQRAEAFLRTVGKWKECK